MTKKFSEALRNKRFARIAVLLLLLILGLFLIMSDNPKEATVQITDYKDIEYARVLESKLKEFLESTECIGEASVFITMTDETSKENGYFADNEKAVKRDRIKGVLISCTDGDRPSIRQKVSELVSTGLGIDTNKIRVTAIDKS